MILRGGGAPENSLPERFWTKNYLFAPVAFLKRFSAYKKSAFTLAEVLITLGIIGIVAAMTLPSVIGNAQKEATAKKVHKFYNTMNNAVQFSIAEHGDVENWMGKPKRLTYEENLQFFKTYFGKHIKYNRIDNCYQEGICVYMQAGGMFIFRYDGMGGDIFYFVNGKLEDVSVRNVFAFQFNKVEGMDEDGNTITRSLNRKTSVEPYAYQWDGTYEKLKTHSDRGCYKGTTKFAGTFCCKLLQMNNWKFTDDYPW